MGNEAPQDEDNKRRQLQEINEHPHKRARTVKENDRKGIITKMSFPQFERNFVLKFLWQWHTVAGL